MSTCQGALPPHDDCPHGDACDWDGWPSREDRAGLQALYDYEQRRIPAEPPTLGEDIARMIGGDVPVRPWRQVVPNRADRRRARRPR